MDRRLSGAPWGTVTVASRRIPAELGTGSVFFIKSNYKCLHSQEKKKSPSNCLQTRGRAPLSFLALLKLPEIIYPADGELLFQQMVGKTAEWPPSYCLANNALFPPPLQRQTVSRPPGGQIRSRRELFTRGPDTYCVLGDTETSAGLVMSWLEETQTPRLLLGWVLFHGVKSTLRGNCGIYYWINR